MGCAGRSLPRPGRSVDCPKSPIGVPNLDTGKGIKGRKSRVSTVVVQRFCKPRPPTLKH